MQIQNIDSYKFSHYHFVSVHMKIDDILIWYAKNLWPMTNKKRTTRAYYYALGKKWPNI